MVRSNKDQMDSWETLRGHLSNITRVVEYCENQVDCRRQQVLLYFNEPFDPLLCQGTCDNCAKHGDVVVKVKIVFFFVLRKIKFVIII